VKLRCGMLEGSHHVVSARFEVGQRSALLKLLRRETRQIVTPLLPSCSHVQKHSSITSNLLIGCSEWTKLFEDPTWFYVGNVQRQGM
jgi:hypothetical protein